MQKNQKKNQKKILANFCQKRKSIAFTFRLKMAKLGPKFFFSKYHSFLLSMTSGHSKNAKKSKKNQKIILANFCQKCKSIAFTFRRKMAKFGPKFFFSKYHSFLLSIASGHSKNAKKSK